MEASTGVLRQFVSINNNPLHHISKISCPCSKVSMLRLCSKGGTNLKSRKLMVSGIYDEGCLEYYDSGRGRIRCGKKEKNKVKDVELKKTKKKLKLLKGLSKNLSNLSEIGFSGFDSDVGLVDQVQEKTISEAAELLLAQLQQLKAEEKELKRKRKEEKALMKMKEASQVQDTRNCEMSSSSSSSSSSSESSDDECENLVDMKTLNCKSLAQTIPEACERVLENATSCPDISTIANQIIEPQTLYPAVDASVEFLSTTSITSLEVPSPASSERKEECSIIEASDCYIGNVGSSITLGNSNATVAATTMPTGTKKVEVCMGGKCKKSGAAAILEKFQQVLGIEATVSGCKCMGKCKVGPNVKVSGCNSSSIDAFQAGDSVSAVSSPSASSNSLCIGVGLEDVNLIAANLLGRYQEVGLANAAF